MPQFFHYIGSAANRRSSVIAMFDYLLSRACHNKTSQGGNIKSVFPIAPRSYYIDYISCSQVGFYRKLQKSISEPFQFCNSNTAHHVYRYEGGYFMIVVFPC